MPLGLSINLLGSLVNNTDNDAEPYGFPPNPNSNNNQYPSIKPNRGGNLPPMPNLNPNLNPNNNPNNGNLFNYIA